MADQFFQAFTRKGLFMVAFVSAKHVSDLSLQVALQGNDIFLCFLKGTATP